MAQTLDVAQTSVDEKNGIAVELLDPQRTIVYWPYIAEMLDKVPHTWESYTKESLLQMAVEGRMQIWLVGTMKSIHLVLFTQIAVYPTKRTLEIFWACGEGMLDMSGLAVDGALEHFAAEHKCAEIAAIGRFGWEKVLGSWGFKRTAVILTRPVINRSLQ